MLHFLYYVFFFLGRNINVPGQVLLWGLFITRHPILHHVQSYFYRTLERQWTASVWILLDTWTDIALFLNFSCEENTFNSVRVCLSRRETSTWSGSDRHWDDGNKLGVIKGRLGSSPRVIIMPSNHFTPEQLSRLVYAPRTHDSLGEVERYFRWLLSVKFTGWRPKTCSFLNTLFSWGIS